MCKNRIFLCIRQFPRAILDRRNDDDDDWKPIVWTQAERAKGQAWGLQTVSSFHTYGTPPVE